MTDPQRLSEDVEQTDIDDAVTANRAILQERFPDLDISVGGPIDGLLVDGLSIVTARNDADVDTAYLKQQLQAIADGTVTVTDDEMDQIAAGYFVERRNDIPATGTVVFVVRDNTNYVIQGGYTIRSNGQAYTVGETYTVYPVGSAEYDSTVDTDVLLSQRYDAETGYLYRFELPVTSGNSVPAAIRVAGDRFTADQSFDALGYIEAVTNFQGGQEAETNAEVAARALEGVTARTVGGRDHVRTIVTDTVPLADSNTIGVGNALMTRDRNNVFNLPTGGKVDVYVKSGAVAQTSYVVDALVVDQATRALRITLSRAQSAGVYRVEVVPLYSSSPPVILTGAITIDGITNSAWTPSSGFSPEMPSEVERAFSARQELVIDFTDNRTDAGGNTVTITGDGTTISDTYIVNVDYQPQLLDFDAALTSSEVRPAGTDVLVKAAVPCITTVGVIASIPDDYNGPDAADLEATLASAINLLPISTQYLDSFTISNILKEQSSDIAVTSVTLSGTIYGQDGQDIAVGMSAGRLTIPTNTVSKVSYENTYFTTNSSLVSVSLV